jgi:hypothetical protein
MAKKTETEAVNVSIDALAEALTKAITATKPLEKKTVATRTKRTPWSPKDGSPKLKLRRKMFHHGIPLTSRISNEEIELLNRVRPGTYCEGFIRVTLRKDKGLDIDYPVKTASQRLKLPNLYGITSFKGLLERLVDEAKNPATYRKADDLDIYDLES